MTAYQLEVRLITDAHQQQPVAELWCEDGAWGRVLDVNGTLYFEIVPRPDGEPWRFPPEAVERILDQARRALLGEAEEAERPAQDQKEAS